MAFLTGGIWKKEDFFLKFSLQNISEKVYITTRISQLKTLTSYYGSAYG
jgi:hypothetical protein